MNWSASQRRARRRWLPVALVVVALHLLLVGLWQRALYSPSARPAGVRPPPVLVWLRPLPPPEPPADATAQPTPPPRPALLRRRSLPVPAPEPESKPIQAAALPSPGAASAPAATASAATASASAPGGRLLDSEATRRAIRDVARQRSTSEMAAEASGASAPLGAQERLSQEMARGARGDCLKGEYAGSGMGLLSLPFWLAAELREKCRR